MYIMLLLHLTNTIKNEHYLLYMWWAAILNCF